MSGCDVCIGADIEEPYAFFTVATKRARRAHLCCECGMPVAIGQHYECVVGFYDGSFDRHKTCLLCREIRDVFSCGSGYYYGQLWEEMGDYVFDRLTTASECFRELSPEAKAFTLERWRVWKFGGAK